MNGKDNYKTLALYIRKGAVRFDNCCLRQTVRNFHYAFNTIARVAQWTRRDPPKVEIAGSSPAVSFFFLLVTFIVALLFVHRDFQSVAREARALRTCHVPS